MMNDLISRAAAIDALKKVSNECDSVYYTCAMHKAVDAINELPTAQPEKAQLSRESTTSDCISRAAAIETTWEEPSYIDPLNILAEVRDRIKALPSAQPEIIRCKDCIYCSRDAIYDDYWCSGREVTADHYCGYAERSEDERPD